MATTYIPITINVPVEDIVAFVEASALYTIPDVDKLVEYCLTSDDDVK